MLWKEFVADRILKREDISEWLSTFFGIPSEAILVLPEKEVFRIDDPMGDEIWVLCETTEREGEFVMQVDVFTRRPELDVLDPHPAIVQLCRTLGVRVVQPNDSPGPYRMLLTDVGGIQKTVRLDADELDDHNRLIISSADT